MFKRTLLIAAGLVLGSMAHAQQSARGPVTDTSAPTAPASAEVGPLIATTKITRSFEDLGSPRQSLKLMGVSNAYTFSIPVSPREKVKGGVLHLETTNSTALIQKRSEISIAVNGQILAQYQLNPQSTRAVHDIPLQLEHLKPGYNDVRIGVVQHYTDDCEDTNSPELWTLIDGKRSSVSIEFEGTVANAGPRLTQLSTAFDRRGWLPRRLTVVSGSETSLSEAELSAAGLAIQGLSLRLDYRPLGVDVLPANRALADGTLGRFPGLTPAAFTDKDVLIVGKRAEISRYLSPDLYGLISGPFVGVFPAAEGASVIIVVSGSTDEELLQASRSLANPEYKYSDMAMERAAISTLQGFQELIPRKAVTFDTLNFRTQVMKSNVNFTSAVEFRAPANFAARKGDFAELVLHASYSAGLRKGSSVDVYLNDTFIKSVGMDNDNGAEINTTLKVPAQFIKAGFNTLSFIPQFLTKSEQCSREAVASVTIFEDSKLEIPEPTLTVAAPDLERYARSLWPQLPIFEMVLTDRRPETASAAMELLALMAQRNRSAVESRFSFSVPATGNVTIVGAYQGLPDSVQTAWPLHKYGWVAEGSHVGVLQAVENKRVLTGFFARDPETLRQGIELLRTKGFWRSLAGSAGLIDVQEQTMRVEGVQEVAAQEMKGAALKHMDMRYILAAIAGLVALVCVVVATIVLKIKMSKPKEPLRIPKQNVNLDDDE